MIELLDQKQDEVSKMKDTLNQRKKQKKGRILTQEEKKELHDKLWNNDFISKTRANIENAISTPEYAIRGMSGDPNFNFFEYLQVAKIPYYLGGIALAAVALGSRNGHNIQAAKQNSQMFKKILTGVVMYYLGREVANTVIDAPVKWFRGVDLNHPYKKITSLREANPEKEPGQADMSPKEEPVMKKKSNQKVFSSVEFTRWDLLYKYKNDPENNPKNESVNTIFDEIARKFGAKKYSTDSDSKVKGKIKELLIMANSWKYILTAPFVTLGLGLAYQDEFHNMDLKGIWNSVTDFVKPAKYAQEATYTNKMIALKTTLKNGFVDPIANAFKSLWKGHNLASKIMGRGAIISSIALPIIANMLILHKSSLKSDNGGNN